MIFLVQDHRVVHSPRNDPDPEMIPNPEMIPKLTPKWSQPRNDPHFFSCRSRNDPQGIREWWLNIGLWTAFCSSLKCWNPVISFYSYEISKKRKVVVGSLFRYSLDPVSFQWTIFAWCNVSNRLVWTPGTFFFCAMFLKTVISGNDDKPPHSYLGLSKNAKVSFNLHWNTT